MLPQILPIKTMLPPFPNRSICFPAACAVNRTPLVFTFITCHDALNQQLLLELLRGESRTYFLEVLTSEVEPRRRRRREQTSRSDTNVHPSLLVPDHLPDLPHRFLYQSLSSPPQIFCRRGNALAWSVTSWLTYSNAPSGTASRTLAHSSPGCFGRSTQYTFRAPASASVKASSSPIPRLAPVTSATRSASENSFVNRVESAAMNIHTYTSDVDGSGEKRVTGRAEKRGERTRRLGLGLEDAGHPDASEGGEGPSQAFAGSANRSRGRELGEGPTSCLGQSREDDAGQHLGDKVKV